MAKNPRDLRTEAIVLRRTDYGEADRILNLLTPEGKMAVMAKGVRKPRSKLAGGIEMFTLADVNIARGRGEFGILTGAKMLRHYGGVVKDLGRMELASAMLKRVSLAAESTDNPEYFRLVDMGLAALDNGDDVSLVEAWFWLRLVRETGEEVNLYRDIDGMKLSAGERYDWHAAEGAFAANERGEYGVNEIKMLRLLTTVDYGVAGRVKTGQEVIDKALRLARSVV